MNDPMAGLDRWITGNYGEDQYSGDNFCKHCTHNNDMGGCLNEDSPFFGASIQAEDFCDEFEKVECDRESLDDRRYHERVDRELENL